MKASKRTLLLATLMAAFTLAAPVHAQTAAHDHDHASSHALTLNQGAKWATDAPLRDGMTRIREQVAPQVEAAHAGKLDAAQYRALAQAVETEVAGIVANCKLEPAADAVLHVVLADMTASVDAMRSDHAGGAQAAAVVKLADTLNQYESHFEHPGFQPIHATH